MTQIRYRRENLETRMENERREFFAGLTNLDRRSFLKVSAACFAAASAAGMAGVGSFQPMKVALGQDENGREKSFKIAYISDSHLYQKHINDRFANALMRAVQDVNALEEAPDFIFYGGDLAQLGQPEELELGAEILANLKYRDRLRIMVGEHDWYFDMGEKWRDLFGDPNWSFDHKGVHFVCLMSVNEEDFWTEAGLSPLERMQTVAGLDNQAQRPFFVGQDQIEWLKKDLEACPDDMPIIVFSHSPLYKLYKNWNFWTDDAEDVQAVLKRFARVTVVHGHTHQVLTNRIGNIHFHGLLSTAWPWPYAPKGMPEWTVQMNRSDPFNSLDGCGNGEIQVSADGLVDKVYNLWNRKPMLVSAAYLNGDGTSNRPMRPNLPSF
ncbi:MAG: metallophosphoesterase [Planctomycetia bacterium]|nr:metallophosphoesterase [Planctomycetia bacterium]